MNWVLLIMRTLGNRFREINNVIFMFFRGYWCQSWSHLLLHSYDSCIVTMTHLKLKEVTLFN